MSAQLGVGTVTKSIHDLQLEIQVLCTYYISLYINITDL